MPNHFARVVAGRAPEFRLQGPSQLPLQNNDKLHSPLRTINWHNISSCGGIYALSIISIWPFQLGIHFPVSGDQEASASF